jgi:superfamily I DNA/RNA helicase/RecB family exonuclease
MPASDVDLSPAALTEPGLHGTVRLLGGPGTGKSHLLTRIAATRIAAGCDPECVLLLTGSARLGMQARSSITSVLLGEGTAGPAAVREPLVRTVHSYAFAVLGQAARRNGDPPPRLITTAEQDGIIRELLAGDFADGDDASVRWPAELRAALLTVGFATELRDLLARCTERGVDPLELQRIGRRAGRPEWVAAGRFAQVYEQVMLLRSAVGMAEPQATVPALGAAELVGAALEAFATDPELLAAERARIQLLLVDDAAHLDPQATRLVRVLAAGAELTVIAGDRNQSVFGYRGADPELLRDDAAPAVVLTESRRCAPAVARAVSGIARRLPGADEARDITGDQTREGSLSVRIAASSHAESALIADALRRAHLVDGVPWSAMAVIVRSVPRAGAALARALTAAGVPVEQPSTTALADHPAVASLLTVLDATLHGLDGDRALSLVTGPIGRVDPVSLRQLRRALRRADGQQPRREFADLLVEALEGAPVDLPDQLARPLRRVAAVLSAAKGTDATGRDPRVTLWQAWHHCGLQRRWLTATERGGHGGVQAGRDLDAVTALFDVTEQYVARTAGASVAGLVDHIRAMVLPATVRDDWPTGESVAVVSAHAALGREWEVVVIAGLQEGLWPNTVPRGGVLGTQRLVDVLDGVADPLARAVSTRAPLLAEERRLLIAALGRARTHVVVTAVDGQDGDESTLPSPFCAELAALATDAPHDADPVPAHAPRVLAPAALVGRLRAVVCAPAEAVDETSRLCAAMQLARLAEAGIAGADPGQWYGTTPLSTDAPLWSGEGHVVTLSPSRLQMIAELERHWAELPFNAQWHSANELERHRAMLSAFAQWRARTRHEFTEVGAEVDVDGVVEPADGQQPGVRVRGRVDRLERDAEGRLVVVDVKTGKTPISKDDAQRHAQLAAYQMAIAEGLLPQGDQPGGARLVYVGKVGSSGVCERTQDPMTDEARELVRESARRAAAATQGPEFVARINDGCAHCPVRAICPAQAAIGGRS